MIYEISLTFVLMFTNVIQIHFLNKVINVFCFLFLDTRQLVASIMRLTRKQFKTFNRINKKLKTIPLFFINNYDYLMRKYSYLKKSHYIVKCQLKKKEKVLILFNQLQLLSLNRKEVKEGKKQHLKKLQKERAFHRSTSNKSKVKPESRVIKITNDGGKTPTAGKEPTQHKTPGTEETETVCLLNGF